MVEDIHIMSYVSAGLTAYPKGSLSAPVEEEHGFNHPSQGTLDLLQSFALIA